MAMTNAERQAQYKRRLQRAAYENGVRDKQIAALEKHLNEARAKLNLPEIQLPKAAEPRPK